MPFIFSIFLMTAFSFATVTVGTPDCPQQFDGRVGEIIKTVGSSSPYATQSVVFKNLSTIKGEVPDQVSVEMLEHGPFEIERGEDYRVQIRAGRVCWVEKI